jgi:outer membrane protein assembly factor BamD
MAHFRQMEKPDRDRTQAREAEDEFQTFLQKYPNDPLKGKAEQHLREVQEVLAEGDYRIGYFYYYGKADKRAAASRLISVVSRYPLYSKADQALWMLGNIWEGSEKKEVAAPFYARIVRDYPLSPLAPKAKERLTALKAPVPQADPKAVAWMTAEQNAPRPHESFIKRPLKIVVTHPGDELRVAARTGTPTMTPESDNEAGLDILTGGNQTRIAGAPGNSIVANVTPGGTASPAESAESVAPAGTATEPKADGQPDGGAPAASDPNAAAPAAGTNEAAPKTDGSAETPNQTPDAAKTDAAAAQDATKTESKDDKKKESSSKKKKGLRKIVPW